MLVIWAIDHPARARKFNHVGNGIVLFTLLIAVQAKLGRPTDIVHVHEHMYMHDHGTMGTF